MQIKKITSLVFKTSLWTLACTTKRSKMSIIHVLRGTTQGSQGRQYCHKVQVHWWLVKKIGCDNDSIALILAYLGQHNTIRHDPIWIALPKVAKVKATFSLTKAVLQKNVLRLMYTDDYFETKMARTAIVLHLSWLTLGNTTKLEMILFELHFPR